MLSDKPHSYWYNMNWNDAQNAVGRLCHEFGFIKLQEKVLTNGKRADIIVFSNKTEKNVIGILEIKTYTKISKYNVKAALSQVSSYLIELHKQIKNNQRWNKNKLHYFIAVIYTKDYPLNDFTFTKQTIKNKLTSVLDSIPVSIIICRPEDLKKELLILKLIKQENRNLDEYFD